VAAWLLIKAKMHNQLPEVDTAEQTQAVELVVDNTVLTADLESLL
jgi:hypothetical protein